MAGNEKGAHLTRRLHMACLTGGMAAAMAIGSGLAPSLAVAQTSSQGPGINARPSSVAPAGRSQISQPAPAAEPAPSLAAPIRRADDENQDSTAENVDPAAPRLPIPPVDGVLEPPDQPAIVDGLDPATVDTRPQEDVQAFEPVEPHAGYDPAAFAIELDPILDRRPAQLFRFEPYDPVGIRMGTFIVYPEIETAGAAFSNQFHSSANVRPDTALELRPAIRAVSNWRVHALEFNAHGLASFHNQFPDEDDRAYTLEAKGRLDITRRTNIETSLSRDITQESRGSVNAATSGGDRTEIATERAGVTLNHRFNRLAVQLRGAIAERDYAPTTDAAGGFVSNDERDVTQRETALRATWSFKPELAAFAEIGLDDRTYGAASRSDGMRRDSTGERYRTGMAFGNTGRVLRGEVSVGAASQRFDDGRLPSINGVIVDANLGWRLSGLTSLLFSARSDIGESTVAGSGGSITRSAGVEVRHAFRRHLLGTAGLRLTRSDFEGVDLVEQDVTATAGLEYYASREVTLFTRYSHIDFETTNVAGNYNADEVRIGVRVRR